MLFHRDAQKRLWLMNLGDIKVFNCEGDQEYLEKSEVPLPGILKKKVFNCAGIYCNGQGQGNYQFTGGEYNNLSTQLFIPDQTAKTSERTNVYYKSILLDVVERKKTLDHIHGLFPSYTMEVLMNLPENIVNQIRKYYSIGDLTAYL